MKGDREIALVCSLFLSGALLLEPIPDHRDRPHACVLAEVLADNQHYSPDVRERKPSVQPPLCDYNHEGKP